MGGSILDFLHISIGGASSNCQKKRGSGWVDFGLSAVFRKKRGFIEHRTFGKEGQLVGRSLTFFVFPKETRVY